MSRLEAILFDMDGVLVYSEPYWKQAEQEIFLRHFGIGLNPQDLDQSMGLKTTEVVQLHAIRYGLTPQDIDDIGHEIERRVIELMYANGQAIDGLYELVDWIKNRGIRRGLVTSSSHYVLEHVLDFLGLEDFFECKVSASDFPKGKPDPAVYLAAIEYLQVPLDHILVIEDSINGAKAALSAGLKVWTIPDRTHYEDLSFFENQTQYVAHNHIDILSNLKLTIS